jgi:hypothetical protein
MQDHELYRRVLGIEAPWYVDSVELKREAGEIHVRLAHHDMIDWPCPECGTGCKLVWSKYSCGARVVFQQAAEPLTALY